MRRRDVVDVAWRVFGNGVLPADLVDRFVAAMRHASPAPIRQEDLVAGYHLKRRLFKIQHKLADAHIFFRPTSAVIDLVQRINHELARPIAFCIASPCQAVNVRIIRARSNAPALGLTDWHSDGFPADVRKVMIYFGPAAREHGSTELTLLDGSERLIEGPPGTRLFFRNTNDVRRGVPPQTGARLAAEITIVPALRQHDEPVFAGFNAAYPEFPWHLSRNTRWVTPAIESALRLTTATRQ